MSNYYYLNNYRNAGAMGISRNAFIKIATIACNNVTGASVSQRGKKRNPVNMIFDLASPVKAMFRRDGKVEIGLQVQISKQANVHETCLKIQQEVANAISMMCETVPFSVELKVVSLK